MIDGVNKRGAAGSGLAKPHATNVGQFRLHLSYVDSINSGVNGWDQSIDRLVERKQMGSYSINLKT